MPLIINDEVGIAKELGVGVHIGQDDEALGQARSELGPDAIIGVSCHNVAEALEAEKAGADYLGVGAVFSTATKKDTSHLERRELEAICAAVSIPIVAIGGISLDNLKVLGGSGIDGVAVVSAIFAARDIRSATMQLASEVDQMLKVPAPRLKGAIVDLDGTLIDSLPYWDRLGADYLASKGIVPKGNLREQLASLEIESGASFLKSEYGLDEDVPTICRELLAGIESVYREKAPLLPGARELLLKLRNDGVRMALFTATAKPLAIAALQRTGVYDFFDCVISTMDLGMEKSSANAYYRVLGRLGTALSETTVYDDAEYALEGARKAGFKTQRCGEMQ